MWNRAALMEASMVAFIVAAWYCYVRAQTQPLWGALAAACALLAFFTKAAAAFFIAAIGIEVVLLVPVADAAARSRPAAERLSPRLAGLVVVRRSRARFLCRSALDGLPFYNWQMSVTRKPSYDARSLLNRVTWFPIVHDIFTRLWFLVVVGMVARSGFARAMARAAAAGAAARHVGRSRRIRAARCTTSANERRFIFFIPALVALTALVLGRDRRLLPTGHPEHRRRPAALAAPVRLLCGVYRRRRAGAAHRAVRAGTRRPPERCAGAGVHGSRLCHLAGRLTKFLAGRQWTAAAAIAVAALVCAGQLVQFGQWAAGRTYKNYLAMVELGRILPPGTLVHGKLANGLSLENRIKPDLRRPRIRKLRRPEASRRCAVYFDLRCAIRRVRRTSDSRRVRRLPESHHHQDVRRRRNHRSRPGCPDRQVRGDARRQAGQAGRSERCDRLPIRAPESNTRAHN